MWTSRVQQSPRMNARANAILRLDSAAGFVVGIVVLTFHGWLARLYALPASLVIFTGVANVVYASYSGALVARVASKSVPSRRAIDVLIIANLVWAAVCTVLLVMNCDSASRIGMAVLAVEAAFVGALAFAENRYVRPLTN